MSRPMPVIVCGGYAPLGAAIKESLKPEYKVIHITLSLEVALADLPILLRGEKPSTEADNVGTKNYSKQAEAVVVGAVYQESQVLEMREACKGVSSIPWLRPDKSTPMPPYGPAYGAAIVERVKAALIQLAEEKNMGSDGLYHY